MSVTLVEDVSGLLLSLEDLAAPYSSADQIGTFVTGRSEPPDGVREHKNGVSVLSNKGVDGLREASGPDLIAPVRAYDETEGDMLERIIRLSSVGERYLSIYLGTSEFTQGAAHANNSLECSTYDRKTRKRLSLFDLLPKEEADLLLRRARTSLRYSSYSTGSDVSDHSFLLQDGDPEKIVLCAQQSQGVVIEISAASLRCSSLLEDLAKDLPSLTHYEPR